MGSDIGTTQAQRAAGITGIGYQGLSQAELVRHLVNLGGAVVADVRLTPSSRMPGLSKSALQRALADEGVDYTHLPQLGNPRDNRAGFSAPGPAGEAARQRYRDILASPAGDAAVEQLTDWAADRLVVALCFEADESTCHRQLVLDAVTDRAARRVGEPLLTEGEPDLER